MHALQGSKLFDVAFARVIPFAFQKRRFQSAALKSLKYVTISAKDSVALIQLNRPEALNALSSGLMKDLEVALIEIGESRTFGAAVITGSQKCFAAGADILEMKDKTYSQCLQEDFLKNWHEVFRNFRKPVIAAVNGYALGGGCELALMCDIIYAGANAKFSQPEIKLGTIPGGGGTQRLTAAVGKSRAMEMILTGRHISAEEAEKIGLVSKIFPVETVVDEAVSTAQEISHYSWPVVAMCKEAINKAFELSLQEGLNFERRLFQSTFALNDRAEGMSAFLQKRAPAFKNE